MRRLAGFLLLLLAAQPVPAGTPGEALVATLSKARTDPHGFAALVRDFRTHVGRDGIFRPVDGGEWIQLDEGLAAIDEAIAFLDAQTPLSPVAINPVLTAAARDYAAEQGATGAMGHVAGDGATLPDRLRARGWHRGEIAETIDYGFADATLVAIELIVDDGVPGRGHRAVVFTPTLRYAGAGCGPHPKWQFVCVVDWSSEAIR